MTTTDGAAAAERILAIDLGRYKSVACDFLILTGEFSFSAIDTTEMARAQQLGKPIAY